jgi:osmotically-inducible protein OsmY
VQIRPDNGLLLAVELAAGPGFDARPVRADAILSADGRLVRLAEVATESADGSVPGDATLRRDMPVRSIDGKRIGRLRLLCFDRASGTVTALVVAGRGSPGLRTLPIGRVREAGPDGIVTDLSSDDWAKLPPFATDWEIKQAFIDKLTADSRLRALQRSITVDVQDQVVTVRGYVADSDQVEEVARMIRSLPGVLQVDRHLITDDDLTRAVTDAIQRDPVSSAAQVQVSAHLGTVDITGVAADQATARRIDSVASQVPGVQVVHNLVSIRKAAQLTA